LGYISDNEQDDLLDFIYPHIMRKERADMGHASEMHNNSKKEVRLK
jgi:hypothetical protein